MSLLLSIVLAGQADWHRVYTDDFERPGPPTPYPGWEQLIDRAHKRYNSAERVAREDDGDPARPPESRRHAISVRCFKGAGAYQTILGDLPDAQGRPIPVSADYRYRLTVHARILQGLHNNAFATLRWIDPAGTVVDEDRSVPFQSPDRWGALTVDVPSVDPRASIVQIVLSLEGPDPRSECLFDDVELVAQPHIRIQSSGRPYFHYAPGESVEADVRFQDGLPEGTRLSVFVAGLDGKPLNGARADFPSGSASRSRPARFRFDPPSAGYYEIRAAVTDRPGATIAEQTMPVLVVGPMESALGGVLGVSVNPATTPYADLAWLIERVGVRHVSFTFWDRGSPDLDALSEMHDRIWRLPQAPELTGVLGRGPEALFPGLSSALVHGHPLTLFSRPAGEWEGALGSTLNRMSRVSRWQVGGDFEDAPLPIGGGEAAFAAASAAIKKGDRSYSQAGLPLVLGDRLPVPASADFAGLRVESADRLHEVRVRRKDATVLEGSLERRDKDGVTLRTADGRIRRVPASEVAALEPIVAPVAGATHLALRLPAPAAGESLEDRAAGLIKQIVALRRRSDLPARILLPLETLAGRGLLDSEGRPRVELGIVRVLDRVLGGTAPSPDLHLFSGRAGEAVFEDGNRAVVVAWSDSGNLAEEVYPGDEARIVDAFGNVTRPKIGAPISLSKMPIYVIDVDRELVRTQSSVAFLPDEVRLQRREQEVELGFTNHFALPMQDVRIGLSADEPGWTITPDSLPLIDEVKPGRPAVPQKLMLQPPSTGPSGSGGLRVRMTFRVGDREHTVLVHPRVKKAVLVEPIIRVSRAGDAFEVSVTVRDYTSESKTVEVTTALPGQPRRRDVVPVVGGRESAPIRYRVPQAAAGQTVEVTLWEGDGSRAVGGGRAVLEEKPR